MSIADHFERVPDAGLTKTYDTGSARRQFYASLTLVTMVAVVATALGMLVRFDRPSSQPDSSLSSSSPSSPPAFAGRLGR